MYAENSIACGIPMVTDLNKKKVILNHIRHEDHLALLTCRSNLEYLTEALTKTCAMQYKQILNKLDSTHQINSAVFNKCGFTLPNRHLVMAGKQ